MLIRFANCCLFCLVTFAVPTAQAQPRTPASDDEVLEHVPDFQRSRALQRLRVALAADPTDASLASEVAGQELELSRLTGESRYLGYAQAALTPWWTDAQASPPIVLLRASVKQRRHDFPEAMADLDVVVAADPSNAKAWFARALVHEVQGNYAAALEDCSHLDRLVDPLASASCHYTVAGLNGRAHDSYIALSALLAQVPEAPAGEQEWAQTTLADIATRLGNTAEAEGHFRHALALDSRDPYLLADYADFLLDQRRPQEVRALLSNTPYSAADPVMLRLALASIAMGEDASRTIADLKERFDIYHQRKDRGATREEARFALECLHQTTEAVALAQENWSRQRDPADARLLLQAALVVRDRHVADPALQWMQQVHVEDTGLSRLAAAVGALS
jgi:Tfp pilus assembly protein PilF